MAIQTDSKYKYCIYIYTHKNLSTKLAEEKLIFTSTHISTFLTTITNLDFLKFELIANLHFSFT